MGAVRWGRAFLALSPVQIGSPSRIVCDQQVGILGNFQLPAQPLGFYELRVVAAAGKLSVDFRSEVEAQDDKAGEEIIFGRQ